MKAGFRSLNNLAGWSADRSHPRRQGIIAFDFLETSGEKCLRTSGRLKLPMTSREWHPNLENARGDDQQVDSFYALSKVIRNLNDGVSVTQFEVWKGGPVDTLNDVGTGV
ncbi:hypothetical protein [Phyllobacterium sp. YR620]|uniref:hypothetical protein n=1 Tax=Phyllobacterium sp. YR620 TaxID=1881066 RepID=UPI0011140572|nr:hypothetical protein [Phyllobacterium sp. YR620]